jgi:hypothetical protein
MVMVAATTASTGACRFGEHHAAPPLDGPSALVSIDAPGSSGDPDANENVFHGLHATIGETPEWTGTCKSVAGYTMMMDRFDPAVAEQDVIAGWDFESDADSYNDPSYGFDPNWPSAMSGRFSVRFRGAIHLAAGTHCFSIDIGATGTDIIKGKNECGQVYVGDSQAAAIAETGYEAATSGPATGCIDLAADGAPELDIVFWYFNIFEHASLHVRHCAGAGCTPDQPLSVPDLVPR